ncbi:two-component system sensor histidine kinase NtrB [Varunaivibrio sulfuroxidans]|uniref:histidine kinase n=1 Tax=Varunaivibrio sulfuroxidans TaxID=1773489 RepID=A0A4R3J770_9PROT|nr:ATP-binding protein [Varunaivibrio sulfuroxidans]TCS61224.1 two-component system nitrogen regulation sensor histidine kinase GlnL [Varunaivibrio sulfuroxidans]WES31155.1 ATP-binding protein [Varunaivibrio sulfuroxidans]
MMTDSITSIKRKPRTAPTQVDADAVLNALTQTVMVIGADDRIMYVNGAAEQFFKISANKLKKKYLFRELIPEDNPIYGLVVQIRAGAYAVSEYGIHLRSPLFGHYLINAQASMILETPGATVLSLRERSITDQIDHRLTHRGAARSVSAMAAMLAHEVKNPLSGIRGAAQLLESSVSAEDHSLTTLIRDETDRICALVDRMDVFSETGPIVAEAVNIHLVLDRVRRLAESGFGRHVRFIEHYDPSLPPVRGSRDQLMQVFVNLVKNACEACPEIGGEIILKTAYKHGVRFAMPGSKSKVHLPLMVSVQDNGQGMAEDVQTYIFDPFVTTKPKGSGLGLPLVAKIVGDHGGVIDFESQPGRTVFRVMLAMEQTTDKTGEGTRE